MSKPIDLFLSYDREDTSVVRELARQLSGEGVRLWFDEWALVPGQRWESALRDAVRESAAVGVCVGPRPVTERTRPELGVIQPGAAVIPILLPLADITELPRELSSRAWIDLRDGIEPRGVRALVEATLRLGIEESAPTDREIADRRLAAGDPMTALRSYESALQSATEPLDAAAALGGMGAAHYEMGNLLEAEQLLRRALELETPEVGESSPDLARHLTLLGNVRRKTGDVASARQIYERVLAGGGLEEREVPTILSNLASIALAQGDLDSAEDQFAAALQQAEGLDDSSNPSVALLRSNLGQVYAASGALDTALAYFETALHDLERQLGPNHPLVASVLGNIAAAYDSSNRLDAAETAARRALAIDETALGPRSADVARDLSNLGTILRDKGDLAAATDALQRASDINVEVFGPNDQRVATNLTNLAAIHRQLGRLSEARVYAERALEIDRSFWGPDHPAVAIDLNNLGQVLADMGDTEGALAALRESVNIFTDTLGAEHPNATTVRETLARLEATGRR